MQRWMCQSLSPALPTVLQWGSRRRYRTEEIQVWKHKKTPKRLWYMGKGQGVTAASTPQQTASRATNRRPAKLTQSKLMPASQYEAATKHKGEKLTKRPLTEN